MEWNLAASDKVRVYKDIRLRMRGEPRPEQTYGVVIERNGDYLEINGTAAQLRALGRYLIDFEEERAV